MEVDGDIVSVRTSNLDLAPRQDAPDEQAAASFAAGDAVVLTGLQNNPELNGRRGVVREAALATGR